jgi:hypothetical protein
MSVPQLVPSQAALPVSWHVAVPVWQLIFPMRHNVVGVQLPPAVQLLQFPSLHTLFAPHDVPLVTLPDSVHTALPVEHDVVPVLHGFDGWQLAPALQVLQLPPLHTLFAPHDVPLSALPDSTHTTAPVAQEIIPVLHGFEGWQLAPALHPLQIPPPHTWFIPHDVPSVTLPVSVQTEVPVEHDVVPVLHGFDGWQPAFAVHGPQLPLLQTMFVPQVAPFERFVPVSVQAIVGAQAILPA